MKRYITMLFMVVGALSLQSLQAQPVDSTFHMYTIVVKLNGEVMLTWTRPASINGATQYELYRKIHGDPLSLPSLITTTNDTVYTDTVPPEIGESHTYSYYALAVSGDATAKSNVVLVNVSGIPLIGSFLLQGKVVNDKVKLQWQAPFVGGVEYFLVYRELRGDSAHTYTKIDSTTELWSITDAPPAEDSIFVFSVKAKLLNSMVLISTYLHLTIGGDPGDTKGLKFISIPPLYSQVGKTYTYTAKAVLYPVDSFSTATITYYGGVRGADGFRVAHVDSVTGEIEWTPEVRGFYKVELSAYAGTGASARQEFYITVTNGIGIIQGKVTDTLNAGIPGVVIDAYSTVNDNTFSLDYLAKTDANGNYRISHVEPGSYKLYAQSPSAKYQSQWYDGKYLVSQADLVMVADSPAVTIANFKLRSGPGSRSKITVTGKVTDTLGLVISNANCRVVFVRAEYALNFGGGVDNLEENFRKYFGLYAGDDFRLEGNSEFVFKTRPDSATGEYNIQLPPGRYIAFARANGYAAEFYQEASDILSADIINVPSVSVLPLIVPCNFTLAPLPPVVLGGISGFVKEYDADGIIVPARIIAFRDRWRMSEKHRVARAYVTDTDSSGAYYFNELLPGSYIVLAIPLGAYAPAFYTGDTSDHRWERATKIEINGNNVDNINIYVKPFESHTGGYTFIQGKVTFYGGNEGGMQGSVKAGAFVYATKGGSISSYGLTDAEGNYTITGLAPGDYSVFVDKLGFEESASHSINVGYSPNGAPFSGNVDFAVQSINAVTDVSANDASHPAEYMLAQNYPNPFNPSTTIRYSLPNAGNVTLKVYDILGKEVATLISGYQSSGKYNTTFNASNLSSGIYFYKLSAGSYNVVKKMLLIK